MALNKWQPIDSAPKDGSVVFLYEANDHPCCGYWMEIDNDDFKWSGWVYADELLADVKPDGLNPTHWMPLPDIPDDRHD